MYLLELRLFSQQGQISIVQQLGFLRAKCLKL